MKNENKYSEMIDIISDLHQYVPIMETSSTTDPSIDPETVDKPTSEKMHPLLFGGDQLTAARGRGCQELRINSDTSTGRLQGLIPVAEDWHTSVTLLVVNIRHAYYLLCCCKGIGVYRLSIISCSANYFPLFVIGYMEETV